MNGAMMICLLVSFEIRSIDTPPIKNNLGKIQIINILTINVHFIYLNNQ